MSKQQTKSRAWDLFGVPFPMRTASVAPSLSQIQIGLKAMQEDREWHKKDLQAIDLLSPKRVPLKVDRALAKKQLQLYNEGYFGNIPKHKAVDGIMGRLTRKALAKEKEVITRREYDDSKRAVINHKAGRDPEHPYWIVDRKKGTLEHYKGDSLLREFPVLTGLQQFDGAGSNVVRENQYSSSGHTMSTPAGIFTLQEGTHQNATSFNFMANGRQFLINQEGSYPMAPAIHLNSPERQAYLDAGGKYKSFGCVGAPHSTLDYIQSKHLPTDTVYVLPVQQGNKFIDNGKKIQPQFTNTPSVLSGKNYAASFSLPALYNTSY